MRYPSARRAAEAVGLSITAVNGRCHSDKWPSYRWLGATPGPRRHFGSFDERRIAKPLIESEPWPNDNGARRAPVMDPNFDPPKVVRSIGWLRCMCCGRFTFSEDVVRVRLCEECGGLGSAPAKDA
nr:hypothetical protein [Stenotrophomonas sp. PS02298]